MGTPPSAEAPISLSHIILDASVSRKISACRPFLLQPFRNLGLLFFQPLGNMNAQACYIHVLSLHAPTGNALLRCVG